MNGISIITLRTGPERHHERRSSQEAWQTFFPRGAGEDPFPGGFGSLVRLDEDRLAPGGSLQPLPAGGGELLTFVSEGALTAGGTRGERNVLRAGELLRTPVGGVVAPPLRNASRTEWARVLRLGLRPTPGGGARGEERRLFTAADRRGRLLLLASREGRDGSLRLEQDAWLRAALLERGHHVVHALPPGRGAWVHVDQGQLVLGGVVLGAGDGAGVTGAVALSITAREPSSVLVLEVSDPPRQRLPGLPGADHGLVPAEG